MPLIKRDPEEIEAIRKLIKAGANFVGPEGDPLVEEAALQKLLMLNPNMTFGVIRQEPDPRDMPARPAPPTRLPLVDLRKYASPVEQQDNIGSCFSNAFIGCVELMDLKDGSYKDKSRLFLFYNAHDIAGTLGDDCGVTIRNTCKAATKFGLCDESIWPYVIKNCWKKPTQECYDQASKFTIKAYKYLPPENVSEVRGYLAQGYPILVGMYVYKGFMGTEIALNGILQMPAANEAHQGGHAVSIVGYDDPKDRFICRNSWGKYWGDGGYFYMPYDYYTQYTFDPWVVVI